ncbi:hypothetical protein NHX12_003009 [Muraenolepis orangiensis]|uniref:Uncharacterized protein n=1 Tax=Muraenolepis orangiensis TaxID=630683 RepID=A0A9Q0IF90_9TELE|nr:hypothetical protein NHX12_003009 [Muraenolepis orangiensis]
MAAPGSRAGRPLTALRLARRQGESLGPIRERLGYSAPQPSGSPASGALLQEEVVVCNPRTFTTTREGWTTGTTLSQETTLGRSGNAPGTHVLLKINTGRRYDGFPLGNASYGGSLLC